MNGRNGIIFEVKRGLRQCGYSGALLRENHIYEDESGEHTIQLAGFARPVYDSRTSCIAVITCEGPEQAIEGRVCEYRDFGAPVALVCCNGTMQWWAIGARGAEYRKTVSKETVRDFFGKQKRDFGPDKISRAKNLGRVDKDQQLAFVDIGLMPLLEEEMGERLGGLMKRVISSLQGGFTERQLEKEENQQWVFQAGFRLLCAKILKDKDVRGFARLRIDDIGAVLEAVRTHYGAQQDVQIATNRQRNAIEEAAKQIDVFASLSNLTTEAFGYMYENVFVDKKLRAALGIHATPSYLVDYIVWQLWPWVKEIPEEKRVVLEPACGHAPFLTGAMRLLRFLYTGSESSFQRYARKSLIGIEKDSFAREIARLSLTMADVPNPNGWNIVEGDLYRGDVLSQKAKNATILLCNPPFEDFGETKATYPSLQSNNKAVEVMWRTLPYLQRNSVFGIIMPRAFLHGNKYQDLRREMVEKFELREIILLPENVFSFAYHKTVVLTGKRRSRIKSTSNIIRYNYVPKDKRKEFKESYSVQTQRVSQQRFIQRAGCNLRVIPLEEVWNYCSDQFKLGTIAFVGRGIEYINVSNSTSRKKFRGAKEGYVKFKKTKTDSRGKRKDVSLALVRLPDIYWMDLSEDAIANFRYGNDPGKPQVLLNYAKASTGPWRLKALIDSIGRPVTNAFIVVRSNRQEWNNEILWGILNSPFANAFAYCHSMERHNLEGTIRDIPLPDADRVNFDNIKRLVKEFFDLFSQEREVFFRAETDKDKARKLLLAIDAEVMRLYDLPPKMEKRVLDLFQGVQRKGVDFEFKGYYPEGFESAIPLHEYLSEEYQRSTVTFVDEWVEKHRSSEISRVLRQAVEAFEEE